MSSPAPNPSENDHPVYIRQEAEKVAHMFSRVVISRALSFLLVGIGIALAVAQIMQAAGFVFLWSGTFLVFTAIDAWTLGRSEKRFQARYNISAKDWIRQNVDNKV